MVKLLDASALVLLFEAKPGFEYVRELFIQSSLGKHEILMTSVNWGEARYALIHKLKDVQKVNSALASLPIKIIDVNAAMAEIAGDYKLKYKLGYCDAIAAAASAILRCECITCDKEFNKLREIITMHYIKP